MLDYNHSILSELRIIHAFEFSVYNQSDNLHTMAGKALCFYYRCMCLYRYPRIQTGRIGG